MAIDFPASPTLNDEYTFEGRTWRWNGTGWEVKEYPAALLAGTAANPSLYFSGDPNTGIYSPGADQLAISTNATQRINIEADGDIDIDSGGMFYDATNNRLGIDTTAPASRLDIDGNYAQNIVAVGALDIDCSAGNYFTKTINGASTFTVSSVPATRSYSFTLELTHTSGAITWFSGVEWPGGTAPTLTTGKTHLFMFITDDGGTRWRAASLINYTN